jgi:hypothetical protein
MFSFSTNNNPVLKNQAFQQLLDKEGYVIVPFYTEEEITKLTEYYTHHAPNQQKKGFQPTTYSSNLEYRLAASEFIKATAHQRMETYFEDYKAFMGSFIVKNADKNSELGVHQDMTLVDESKFMGINIWAPLCDTHEKNGALFLIPGSHRIHPSYRAATIANIYDKHYQTIKEYMKPVYLKAGEAIIFDHSILHYSPHNLSKDVRIATNIFVTHKDAVITIAYHDKEKEKIELFEENDDFFTTYQQFDNSSNMLRPQLGKSIGFKDYNFPVLTPEKLELLYGNLPAINWINKIKKKLFNR